MSSPGIAVTGRSTPDAIGGWRRRTGAIAAGQGAVKGGQLVLAVALVHHLRPHDWSQVAFLLSIHLAATTIGTCNLHHGLLFFLPRTSPDRQRALLLRTAGILVASGCLIAAALVVAPWGDTSLQVGGLVPWIAAGVILELPTACAPLALLAVDRVRGAAMWDLAGTVLLLACAIAPAAAGWGAEGVVKGLALQAVLRLLLFVSVVVREFGGPLTGVERGTTRAHLRYGLPLGLTLATSVLNRSVDKWYVAAFDSSHAGVHAIAAQEIPLLAVLPYAGGAATVAALVDSFRRGDLPEAAGLWLRQTAAMSRVIVPISVAVVLVAPEVFALALPAEYSAGVLSFRLFAAVTVHRVAEYGLVLRAADRNRDVLRAAVVLLVANGALALIGAAGWGMSGASLGTLLANVIAWLFVVRRIAVTLGRPWRAAFPWGPWASACAIAVTAAVLAWTVGRSVDATLARLVAELTVFAGIYLVAARGVAAVRHPVRPGAIP